MEYSASKTLSKAALPAALVVVVNIALWIAKSKGLELDASTVWTIAGAGYAGLVAMINAIKNAKK